MMQGLANRIKQRTAGVIPKLETGASAMLQIEQFDCIVQATGSANDRHGTVLQTIDLVQAARLVARRHEKDVGASFNFVSDSVVVGDFSANAIGISDGQRLEQVFVFLVTSAENDQCHILAHNFGCDFSYKVETFLVGEARNDADDRAAGNVR